MASLGIERRTFDMDQLAVVNDAVALAEEVTSDHFKYSTSQWRRSRYDIRTVGDLQDPEITDQAFAQILRYVGHPLASQLGSARFDFYKICLQDHVILQALRRDPSHTLFPLMLYVITHELVHIVRFSRFLHSFESYPSDRDEEEARVHGLTGEILMAQRLPGIEPIVLSYRESLDAVGVPLDRVREGG